MLSPYTKESNCTDLADVECGINEIRNSVKALEAAGKKVPSYYYIRLSKLQIKKTKYGNN